MSPLGSFSLCFCYRNVQSHFKQRLWPILMSSTERMSLKIQLTNSFEPYIKDAIINININTGQTCAHYLLRVRHIHHIKNFLMRYKYFYSNMMWEKKANKVSAALLTLRGRGGVTGLLPIMTSSSTRCIRREVMWSGQRWERARSGFVVSKDSNRKVFDVCRPLSCQLEKLYVIPLHAVDGHWETQGGIQFKSCSAKSKSPQSALHCNCFSRK